MPRGPVDGWASSLTRLPTADPLLSPPPPADKSPPFHHCLGLVSRRQETSGYCAVSGAIRLPGTKPIEARTALLAGGFRNANPFAITRVLWSVRTTDATASAKPYLPAPNVLRSPEGYTGSPPFPRGRTARPGVALIALAPAAVSPAGPGSRGPPLGFESQIAPDEMDGISSFRRRVFFPAATRPVGRAIPASGSHHGGWGDPFAAGTTGPKAALQRPYGVKIPPRRNPSRRTGPAKRSANPSFFWAPPRWPDPWWTGDASAAPRPTRGKSGGPRNSCSRRGNNRDFDKIGKHAFCPHGRPLPRVGGIRGSAPIPAPSRNGEPKTGLGQWRGLRSPGGVILRTMSFPRASMAG